MTEDVFNWLLDSDPSIRWQVMRDLTDAPETDVRAERSRVPSDGWGALLLSLQQPDGGWSDTTTPKRYIETPDGSALHVLTMLREMGLEPSSVAAQNAIDLARKIIRAEGERVFFEGETEPCINGRVLALSAYFGEPNHGLAQRLLEEQLDDGGWNCEAPPSSRSSFHTTICVLEGLFEYEKAAGANSALSNARERGEEYLLARRMIRSASTGRVISEDWTKFAYPTGWHYDVLRGLEYLRASEVAPDERLSEAIDIVAAKRDGAGRWRTELAHPDTLDFEMEAPVGSPSRWITFRALRVLKWWANA